MTIRTDFDQLPVSEIEAVFKSKFEVYTDQIIAQQQEKVLEIARSVNPHLTPEDILNPHDFPELMNHPTFNYEEGVLSGMISLQIGLRAHLFRQEESET